MVNHSWLKLSFVRLKEIVLLRYYSIGTSNGRHQKNNCVLGAITKVVLYLYPETFEARPILVHFRYGPFTRLRQIVARANPYSDIEFVRMGKSSETWITRLLKETKNSQRTDVNRSKSVECNAENWWISNWERKFENTSHIVEIKKILNKMKHCY